LFEWIALVDGAGGLEFTILIFNAIKIRRFLKEWRGISLAIMSE